MKSFLEEYGFTILAAIVVILIIAMCTPIGNLIKEQVLGVVNSFAAKTEGKLAAIDADAPVKVVLKQTDKNGKFTVVATSDSQTDVFTVHYRIKDQYGNWSAWKEFADTLSTSTYDHTKDYIIKLDNNNQVQFRVNDKNQDDSIYYESNIVTYTGSTTTATASDLA